MPSQRAPIIDALRGFALFGILAVNIQSAAWGVGGPTLGEFDSTSRIADYFAVLFTAFFLQAKFYPIFCFCFGYGLAVQVRGWKWRGENSAQRLNRRLGFMWAMGLLHGFFLWFGDILASYALAGWLLKRHLGKGPRALVQLIQFWLVVVAVVSVLYAIVVAQMAPDADVGLSTLIPTARMEQGNIRAIYASGDWLSISARRLIDYSAILASLIVFLPNLLLLALCGAMTARMGWLMQPSRHRAWLKRVLLIALVIGLPINILFTIDAWASTHDFIAAYSFRNALTTTSVPIFAFVTIAGFALISDSRFGQRLITLLAPAGKIALSNYVFQSLAMTTLLYGYGLGWAKTMRQGDLLALAIAIYLLQLAASHVYARRFKHGPLEWLWRRWTNANISEQTT